VSSPALPKTSHYLNTMNLQIQENTDDQFLDVIKYEWEILCDKWAYCTPFQYPQWLISWWKYFGGSSFKALSIRDEGILVALALFYIYKDEAGVRKCCLMGTGISDYLDIPVAAGKEIECMKVIREYLFEIQSQWDVCDFQELRDSSPFFKEISGVNRADSNACSVCFSKKLDPDPKKIIFTIPKNLRNNLRRAEGKLLKNGTIDFVEETLGGLKSALEQLILLHNIRWEDKRNVGVLREKNIQDFHHEVAMGLYGKQMMRVFTLNFNGKAIASYYVFLHAKKAYAYLGGFDPSMSEFSPGAVALYYIMLAAATNGYEYLDFMRGEEEYKQYWRVEKKFNYSIKIFNNHTCSGLV
jgi:CelD/BcsL family acetyltransferase involved in cellulose biosynthesis